MVLYGSATADFVVGWDASTSNGYWQASAGMQNVGSVGAPTTALGFGDTLELGSSTGAYFINKLQGVLLSPSIATTVTLKWAQRVATAVDSKVMKGSYIRYRKIA